MQQYSKEGFAPALGVQDSGIIYIIHIHIYHICRYKHIYLTKSWCSNSIEKFAPALGEHDNKCVCVERERERARASEREREACACSRRAR